MSRNGKVLVAMSGGVDSSVAAALLKERGYDCVGVFMWVGEAARPSEPGARATGPAGPAAQAVGSAVRTVSETALPRLKQGCCSVGDACDARAVAAKLGIPFYSVDFHAEFERIIEYFVDEYARARTPNPCVVCNTQLKFGKLLAYADMIGAEFVATGHYARVLPADFRAPSASERVPGQRGFAREPVACAPGPDLTSGVCLARALNHAKDQSYVLFGIQRPNLPRCRFPLGDIADKATVRRIAADLGLPVHDKPDSQEICFVPNNDYTQLVRARRPETERTGDVLDSHGRVLGTHAGIANYTVGQRHGLGIAAAQPLYVTRLDAATNTVVLGPRAELLSEGLIAEQVNWLVDPPPTGVPRAAQVQIRYHHTAASGEIRIDRDGHVDVPFAEPQAAVTPGQAAVFYDGEIVLGGGWIARPVKSYK